MRLSLKPYSFVANSHPQRYVAIFVPQQRILYFILFLDAGSHELEHLDSLATHQVVVP